MQQLSWPFGLMDGAGSPKPRPPKQAGGRRRRRPATGHGAKAVDQREDMGHRGRTGAPSSTTPLANQPSRHAAAQAAEQAQAYMARRKEALRDKWHVEEETLSQELDRRLNKKAVLGKRRADAVIAHSDSYPDSPS